MSGAWLALLLPALSGCNAPDPGEQRHPDGADADSDTDADTDTDADSDTDADTGPAPLQLAIPGYFYPDLDAAESLWRSALVPGAVFVFNPASGPGSARDATYASAVQAALDQGVIVLAYVSTRYGERPASEVRGEMDTYASWYPLSGYFLDEGPGTDTCDSEYDAYAGYSAHARASAPTAFIAINPGTDTCASYLDFADVLLTYESDATDYATWTTPAWTAGIDPSRLWHLVYGAPDPSAMQAAIDHAREAGVGWVYVTDDVLPNPWDTLPAYWSQEQAAL